ncbi:MAG: PQQ-dependent sugar dehydrogenase [Chloroflexota bacterium]
MPTSSQQLESPNPSPTLPPREPPPTPDPGPSFDLNLSAELFVDGFPPLTFLANAGDGSGLLYAVGQNGVISVLSGVGSVQVEPFLDIDDRIRSGGEQGLLGLAFHPDYESNGRFFVNYTDNEGDTVVSEFSRSDDQPGSFLANPDSERILLTIDQPFANHNGGMIAFGADGYLYIGMGDGGSGGDPQGNGQAPATLLGKMLRIDVNSGDPYRIPADNPFVGGTALPEIWSFGLRNPWRFSFDRMTGAMFIGDVGQGAREEIDAERAGEGGRNYGWNIMEGDICYRKATCDATGLTPPVAVNDRSNGECAVTGGYVYRGANWDPELTGAYVFSDYCTGTLWGFDADSALANGNYEVFELGNAGFGPSSFGEDEAGELYLVNLIGEIYRLVATPR